jgi:hypothetical protein
MILRYKVFWLSFLVILCLAIFLVSRVKPLIPGATSAKLVAGCEIAFLDTRLQPAFTVVLACPRVDSIRLWPLPVIYPWFEVPANPGRPKDRQAGLPGAFLEALKYK